MERVFKKPDITQQLRDLENTPSIEARKQGFEVILVCFRFGFSGEITPYNPEQYESYKKPGQSKDPLAEEDLMKQNARWFTKVLYVLDRMTDPEDGVLSSESHVGKEIENLGRYLGGGGKVVAYDEGSSINLISQNKDRGFKDEKLTKPGDIEMVDLVLDRAIGELSPELVEKDPVRMVKFYLNVEKVAEMYPDMVLKEYLPKEEEQVA